MLSFKTKKKTRLWENKTEKKEMSTHSVGTQMPDLIFFKDLVFVLIAGT